MFTRLYGLLVFIFDKVYSSTIVDADSEMSLIK